jgi:hypothetical protein
MNIHQLLYEIPFFWGDNAHTFILYKTLESSYHAAMNNFDASRRLFAAFRERLSSDDDLRAAFEAAIDTLRSSYNSAIYENRFIVGGAIEWLFVAVFNGAGFSAQHVGRGDTRIDLQVRDSKTNLEAGFSSKQSATLAVRLINKLGNGVSEWKEPTLFVFDGVGVVYADPGLLPDATVQKDDALVMDGNTVKEYIAVHPEQVISLRVQAPAKGSIPSSKTASEDVARAIVRNFPRLSLP